MRCVYLQNRIPRVVVEYAPHYGVNQDYDAEIQNNILWSFSLGLFYTSLHLPLCVFFYFSHGYVRPTV